MARNTNKGYVIKFDRAAIRAAYMLEYGRKLDNDECDDIAETLERTLYAIVNDPRSWDSLRK